MYMVWWLLISMMSIREGKEIKIKIAVILCIFSFAFAGCTKREIEPEHTTYITAGRYYTCGEVITDDGNVWAYSQDIISERESYDHQPVFALIDDNGTPDNIYDDEVYGLVLDRETKVYDELEAALSDAFTVERNGNIISISQGGQGK